MIVGHKKQIEFLEGILESKSIPQAYIFSGPESVGKFFIAKAFADALNTGKSKITGEITKDNLNIEILSPEIIKKRGVIKTKNIEIKDVRKVQKNLSLFPFSGKFKALIINEAHTLNIPSQNALLKILEEPNKTSIIIMITHNGGNILDTIKSRCQKINFNLVALDEIKKFFQERSEGIDFEKLAIFSMGKPGEAERLANDKERMLEKENFIRDLAGMKNKNLSERIDLAEKYSKNILKSAEMLEFWIWFIRLQGYKNLKDNSKVEKYYKIIKIMEEALEKIKNPSFNSRLILENLLFEL